MTLIQAHTILLVINIRACCSLLDLSSSLTHRNLIALLFYFHHYTCPPTFFFLFWSSVMCTGCINKVLLEGSWLILESSGFCVINIIKLHTIKVRTGTWLFDRRYCFISSAENVATQALEHIYGGDTIMTIGKSRTVLAFLKVITKCCGGFDFIWRTVLCMCLCAWERGKGREEEQRESWKVCAYIF